MMNKPNLSQGIVERCEEIFSDAQLRHAQEFGFPSEYSVVFTKKDDLQPFGHAFIPDKLSEQASKIFNGNGKVICIWSLDQGKPTVSSLTPLTPV